MNEFNNPYLLIQSGYYPKEEKKWKEIGKLRLGDVHPNRLREWALGRVALERLLISIGIELHSTDEFINHQKLLKFPNIRFSLSHTSDYAAVWFIYEGVHHGVGIDIEKQDRSISKVLFQKFHNLKDIDLEPLKLWIVKEAAYKALPKAIQQKVWLNSITVSKSTFKVDGHRIDGLWSISVDHTVLIARALV